MRPQQLLKRISNSRQNVRFSDTLTLARALGFELDRTEGSHHILRHPSVPELLNLQKVHDQAKPYQLKQLLHLLNLA